MRRFNDLLLCDELHAVFCNCRFLNANNAKLQRVLHRRCDAFHKDEIGGHEKKLLSIENLYILYLLRIMYQNVTLS